LDDVGEINQVLKCQAMLVDFHLSLLKLVTQTQVCWRQTTTTKTWKKESSLASTEAEVGSEANHR
jgi:hypothetical protein